MVYKWKKGACFKASAKKCFAEIAKLPVKTKEGVVEFARNKHTELHKCFEWDNEKAAENYRLEQARLILRSIIVIETDVDDQELKIRAFSQYTPEKNSKRKETVYRKTVEALNDESFKRQILCGIEAELNETEMKAKTYSRFLKSPKGFLSHVREARKHI
jgi:hypothetical protein